jgi:hypothetical protein
VIEWFTRTGAIHAATIDPTALDARQRSLLARARGALVVAERVAPADGATVPLEDAGDELGRSSVAIGVLRDAVAWALAVEGAESPASLAEAWERANTSDLESAAGSTEALAQARRALFADDALARLARPLEQIRSDLSAARRLAKTLVQRLENRATRVTRLHAQRWLRVLTVVVALGAMFVAVDFALIARRPDLVPNARWTASSADLAWATTGSGLSGPRGNADVFFHTREQDHPFVQFDLGRPRSIARVVVVNRGDCCQDRAVPLAIEVSDDARRWTEVDRNSSPFDTWVDVLVWRRTARYVRLIAPRRTILHLARVEIH